MTDGLRQMLDEVEAQLAAGEERLTASRELIEAEGLSHLLFDPEDVAGYPVLRDDSQREAYAPEWAEPLAGPYFVPEAQGLINELDSLFDLIDEAGLTDVLASLNEE